MVRVIPASLENEQHRLLDQRGGTQIFVGAPIALLPIVSAARRAFAADEVMRAWPRNVPDPETAASATQTRSSNIWIRHAKTSPLQACHEKNLGGFWPVREASLAC